MTSDEWRAQGIEFALSAEGESTVSFLHKAVKCFVHAGAPSAFLLELASAQLKIADVVREMSITSDIVSEACEQSAAEAVLCGLRAGLLSPVKELCGALSGRVKTDCLFEKRIVSVVNAM